MRFSRRPTWGDFYKEIFDLMHKFKMQKSRIDELEAENRRLREALDDIHMHGFEVGANVMVPKVEWDAAFARAALSQEEKQCD